MATTKLYLKDKNAPKSSVILLFLMEGNSTIKISTKEKINPKYWDFDKQCIKRNYVGASELNEYLKSFCVDVEKAFRELRNDNEIISSDNIKKKLYPEAVLVHSWQGHFKDFLAFKTKECTPNTIKKYNALLNHLTNYTTKIGKLNLEDFNMIFYEKFTNYLIDEQNLTNNTIGKYFQGLKTFLGWCVDRDFTNNIEFRKFKRLSEKTDIIYLTLQEIESIKKLDLSKNPRLDRVRDIFLFGCFTGQRYSDIENIKRSDIRDNIWYIRVKKTKDILEVPLVGYVLTILDKYKEGYKPLPSISNQKMNIYLKELGKLSELNTPISVVRYKGVEKIESIKPKYDLISTHTARRTFVTLSLEKGMRPETVMEITGHKDYSIFKKYIKITSKIKQNEMNKIWN